MKFMVIFITLATVHCRPQNLQQDEILERDRPKVTIIPFYGGGKGQSLQITESPDGNVTTTIIKTPENVPTQQNYMSLAEVENPPLPAKSEIIKTLSEASRMFGEQLGEEPPEELENESREGLSAWFSRKKLAQKEKDEKKKKKEEERSEEEKKKKEEKEEEKEKEENKEEGEDDESVAINLPPEEASVAEAKPVGIAIAGEGGVAASKPVGTAVVGPAGLAIARPVGTAIAGIPPDQVPLLGGAKKAEKTNYIGKLITKYHDE